jgi:hypothetical protein
LRDGCGSRELAVPVRLPLRMDTQGRVLLTGVTVKPSQAESCAIVEA